jgi:hypothetical protein
LDSGGQSPVAAFKITGTSGTVAISAPQNSDGTGSVDLIGGTYTLNASSVTNSATAIVNKINDLSYVTGYTAIRDVDKIFIYAPVSWAPGFAQALNANDIVAIIYTAVSDPTAVPGATNPSSLLAIVTPDPVVFNYSRPKGSGGVDIQVKAKVTVSGGTGPTGDGKNLVYAYAWAELVAGSGNGIKIVGGFSNSSDATFRYFTNGPTNESYTITGSFVLLIRDNSSPNNLLQIPIVVQFNVTVT